MRSTGLMVAVMALCGAVGCDDAAGGSEGPRLGIARDTGGGLPVDAAPDWAVTLMDGGADAEAVELDGAGTPDPDAGDDGGRAGDAGVDAEKETDGPVVLEPDAAEVEADGAVVEPDGAVIPPDAAPPEPDGLVLELDAAQLEPDAVELEPDAAQPEPDAAELEPDAAPPEPDAAEPEPDADMRWGFGRCNHQRRIEGEDRLDPNQDVPGARDIVPGFYEDLIIHGGDGDWYRLPLCGGGRITVRVEHPFDGGDIDLQAFDGGARVIHEQDLCDGIEEGSHLNDRDDEVRIDIGVYIFGPPGQLGGDNTYTMRVTIEGC